MTISIICKGHFKLLRSLGVKALTLKYPYLDYCLILINVCFIYFMNCFINRLSLLSTNYNTQISKVKCVVASVSYLGL